MYNSCYQDKNFERQCHHAKLVHHPFSTKKLRLYPLRFWIITWASELANESISSMNLKIMVVFWLDFRPDYNIGKTHNPRLPAEVPELMSCLILFQSPSCRPVSAESQWWSRYFQVRKICVTTYLGFFMRSIYDAVEKKKTFRFLKDAGWFPFSGLPLCVSATVSNLLIFERLRY